MYDWHQISAKAPWQGRDSQGFYVQGNQLWVFGGWYSPQDPNPRDVWSSEDGVSWDCLNAEAPWEHGDLPAVFYRGGKHWLMGGRKVPGKENSNLIWSSPDGREWTQAGSADWCPRVCHSYTEHEGRLWILGGTENFYDDNPETLKNDVWVSDNALDWECVTSEAPWSKRRDAQVVSFKGKIWIIGGGSWHPETCPRNDVWSSLDGVNWNCVTESAAWTKRLWTSVVVYRERLFLFGGWNREQGNFNDVWHSENGREWTELHCETIWTPRHAQSAYVKDDRIWLCGGHAEPVNSEVWTIQLPVDWDGK